VKKLVPSGNLLAMDGKKIKNYDKITPVFTRAAAQWQGHRPARARRPKKVMFLEGES